MTSRIVAASIFLLGIGSIVAPVETSAGSGGLVTAPALAAPASIRPFLGAPPSAHMSMPPRMSREFPARIRDFRLSRLGLGFPLWWGYPSYVPNYYPSDYTLPYEVPPYAYPPIDNFSERSRPVVAHPPECRTDTQKVPSETGGERTINITRCY
jgi:hypothetical protein